jgi:hypothetical protein
VSTSTQKSCIWANHGKGKILKATCRLWHKRVLFKTQAKQDKHLVKLEAKANAKELKARIRAAKMMLQGVTYSQVVGGPVVPSQLPAHVAPHSSSSMSQQKQARLALTPEGAIAMLEEVIGRLRILPQPQ